MRIIKLLFLSLLVSLLVACQPTTSTESQDELYLSNLADTASQGQVEESLKVHLSSQDVDRFFSYVKDYNQTIEATSLKAGFTKVEQPTYDVEKIDQLWTKAKGDFIGTNCRINSYTLLKNSLEIPDLDGDDALLFLDLEAIDTGKLMDASELKAFKTLFGRVPTEATSDQAPHIEKMEAYLSQFAFKDQAHMVSVVFHDDLDGNYLFIGHVGVMVTEDDGVLFVEKLSFQEPYQALKFADKEAVYDYLFAKYALDTGQETARAFVMDNDKVVKSQ